MKLFDFHCDTPFELEKTKSPLSKNHAHISDEHTAVYEAYGQIMAIWTQHSLPVGTTWGRFYKIREDFLSKLTDRNIICRNYLEYRNALSHGLQPFFLAVEGAGLLDGNVENLPMLYANDVRFLTLVWKDETCIGGAFNTDVGLTDFGREVVDVCFRYGIVLDISHASDKMSEEVLKMARDAGKPVIASHSNSRALCDLKRNLPDEYAKEIAALGGTVGVSMVPQHLDISGNANIDTICNHIEHYLELGLSDALTSGSDFDGIDRLPEGIENISSLTKVADALAKRGISSEQIDKIYFNNADAFLARNF